MLISRRESFWVRVFLWQGLLLKALSCQKFIDLATQGNFYLEETLVTTLPRMTTIAALSALLCPAAFAASADISLFDWSWLDAYRGFFGIILLVAVVFGTASSMLASFIFRGIARKFAEVPVAFPLWKGAVFFGVAFLIVQGLTIACLSTMSDMSPSSAFSTTVVFQVAGGFGVALAARQILLRVPAAEVSDFRMLGMTFGTYLIFLFASPLISLVAGVFLSALTGAPGK